jgi:hypothetical protein
MIKRDHVSRPRQSEPRVVHCGYSLVVDKQDADFGLRDPLCNECLSDEPFEPGLAYPQNLLTVTDVDRDCCWLLAAEGEKHYAVLWSGYLTRP